MAVLKLKGIVTQDGQLKVELPENFPSGEVEVTVQHLEESFAWSEDEIRSLMHPEPKTNAEIIAMLQEMGSEGWDHIEDGAAWVENQRRQQAENSQW